MIFVWRVMTQRAIHHVLTDVSQREANGKALGKRRLSVV